MIRILLLFFLGLFSSSSVLAAQTIDDNGKKLRIYILDSYLAGSWVNGIQSGIKEYLADRKIPYILRTASQDGFNKTNLGDSVIQYNDLTNLSKKIRNFKPDYIVLADDEAMNQVLPKLYQLKIPIIFTGINSELNEIPGLNKNRSLITGVLEREKPQHSYKLLVNLSKKPIKRITVISSQDPTSQILVEKYKQFFADKKYSFLDVEINKIKSWENWKKKVLEANSKSDALWILSPWDVTDERHHELDIRVMGKWLSENIKIPSVSGLPIGLNMGTTFCIAVSPEPLGREAGKLIATNFIDEKPLKEIEVVEYSKGSLMINKFQTDKFDISIPPEILEYAEVVKKPNLNFKR